MQGFGPLFRMIEDRIEAFLADRGYDADAIRQEIAAAGVDPVIPARSNRRNPVLHDREKYRWRNLVERLFNKLRTGAESPLATTKPKNPTLASSPSRQSNSGYPLSTKPRLRTY